MSLDPNSKITILWLTTIFIWKVSKKNTFVNLFINFPFTLLHELSHYVIGLLLLAKPVGFTVIPKVIDDRIVLGQVAFTGINAINGFFIGISPLLLSVGAYYIYNAIQIYLVSNFTIALVLNIIMLNLFWNSIPSIKDLKVAIFDGYIGFIATLSLVIFLTLYR